ncbi:MAG: OmpH family outer membrane protein [Bacteroidales bacterium]|nr:OmpH family outer membrane protein [Candidatus Colimorpha onthohippi]
MENEFENTHIEETQTTNETTNVQMDNNSQPMDQQPRKRTCKCCGNPMRCLVIVNIVLLIGLIVLYIFHFTGVGTHSKVNTNAKAPVVGQNGTLKIAYVNSDSLIAKYQYAQDLEAELKAYKESQERNYQQQMANFQNDYQKLQTEYQEYLKTGDQLTLTQQKAKEKEFENRKNQLEQRAAKMQGLEGELTMKIQEKVATENERMLNAIFAFIREYNEANQQFDVILRKTMNDSPTLYVNPGMDITDEIINGLNEEYKNIKKQ